LDAAHGNEHAVESPGFHIGTSVEPGKQLLKPFLESAQIPATPEAAELTHSKPPHHRLLGK
ncbi:hypothetical protein DF186_23840, partial [Enterococcus hirae]